MYDETLVLENEQKNIYNKKIKVDSLLMYMRPFVISGESLLAAENDGIVGDGTEMPDFYLCRCSPCSKDLFIFVAFFWIFGC